MKYFNNLRLQTKFIQCGNPLTIDTYRKCDFNCLYCFSPMLKNYNQDTYMQVSHYDNLFNNIFNKGIIKNLIHEMVSERIPLRVGNMSDAFQHRELKDNISYNFIKMTKKYKMPLFFITKTGMLPDKYFEIFDKNLHAFSVSMIGLNQSFVNKFEKNTPEIKNKIKFIEKLKSMGFWVSVRIHPLIDEQEARLLVNEIKDTVDYITIEFLDIKQKQYGLMKLLDMENNYDDYDFVSNHNGNYGLKHCIKRDIFLKLKQISKVKISSSFFPELSDSNNCCGIDTVFNKWHNYNSFYFKRNNNFNGCNCFKNTLKNLGCYNGTIKRNNMYESTVSNIVNHSIKENEISKVFI